MEYKTLGERIKYHRKRLGLTQEQLAERVRVSAQAVSKWENNLSCPDISVLPELADVFGISLDELMGRSAAGAVCQAEPVETQRDKVDYSWHWEAPMRKRHSVIFAVFVLIYGGLLLLNNVMSYDVSWWTLLWTLSLCFIGVSGLCHGFSLFCLLMTLSGSFFLMDAYSFFSFELGWGILIPAILIIWGISLLLDLLLGKKKKIKKAVHLSGDSDGKAKQEYSCVNGWLSCEMCFSDHRTAVVTPLLRGGNIECNFGTYTVDFSGCEALAENCRIEVENNFGNLTLLVPDQFQVKMDSNDTFIGSVSIYGTPASETKGQLIIDGESNFGSIEIKYI